MGDEDHRRTVTFLHGGDQLDDTGLDRHVEGGCRLVGDEKARAARKCHGDQDALAHAAGKLVGIFVEQRCAMREVDGLKFLQRALAPSFAGAEPDVMKVFLHLLADTQDGIETGKRLLRNEGDVTAEQLAAFAAAHADQILAVEGERSLRDGETFRQELRYGAADHRFSGAGLTDEPEDLARLERKVEIGEDREPFAPAEGFDAQAARFKNGIGHVRCAPSGSGAYRGCGAAHRRGC